MGPEYLDAHLHIADGAALKLNSAVKYIFLNSTSKNDLDTVAGCVSEHLTPFFGLHPWYTAKESVGSLNLEAMLDSYQTAGVGECGLDHSGKNRLTGSIQLQAFETQVKTAFEYGRPLSIHCVRAWGQVISVLKKYSPLPAPFILHSFYGSAETAEILINLGGYISLSGMSLRNPVKSSPIIAGLPLNRVLIESDLLAGEPGFTAEMHFDILRENYRLTAEILGISEKDFISGVVENGKIFTN